MLTASVDESVPEPVADNSSRSGALGFYSPALDGWRAVAMVVMLSYHLELHWAKGAFLALSQFFTLSGFLITSILLRRREATGTVQLGAFWAQRYRRLMPGALAALAFIIVFVAFAGDPIQIKELPGQVTAAVFWVENWYLIFTHTSYMDLFSAPSPVQHFWSLAVEEQFYLLMPLAFFAITRWTKSLRALTIFFAAGSLASTLWMLWLYDHGASLSRLYVGTDTRAAELLMGGLLAVVLHQRPLNLSATGRKVVNVLGIAAYALSFWAWTHIGLVAGPIWRGGFLGISILTCLVIVSILAGGTMTRAFSWGFLPAMGRLTYTLYLFHWPIFLWLDGDRTGLSGLSLIVVRLAVTFALSIASYHLLEMPILRGAPSWLQGKARWAAAPIAMIVLIAAANIVGNGEARGEASPLRTPIDAKPPAIPRDGVLDVLVISDGSSPKLTEGLVAEADESDALDVTVAEPFSCEGLGAVREDGEQTCANWDREWAELINTEDPDADKKDPDVVLFAVDDWDPAQLTAASGIDSVAQPDAAADWMESTLQNGFDLLTARGANVVWAPLPQASGQTESPFTTAMGRVEAENEKITSMPEDASLSDIDAVVPVLTERQRAGGASGPKVLVVGDSMARTMGYGLERWAADTGAAVMWTTATMGCGLGDEGSLEGLQDDGQEVPLEGTKCAEVHEGWTEQIEQFDPDLVIVLSTLWDAFDRRLPEWDSMKSIGDPELDEYLLREYETSVDELSAGGAKVLWVKGPCSQFNDANATPGLNVSDAPFDVSRVEHLNDVIIPQLVEARPEVKTFDLFDIMCPNGEFLASPDGTITPRPDGIHFSAEGAAWLAENYGDAMLKAGLP